MLLEYLEEVNAFNRAVVLNSMLLEANKPCAVEMNPLSTMLMKSIKTDVAKLQITLPKVGAVILEEYKDRLPEIEPYGLSLDLIAHNSTGDIKKALKTCDDIYDKDVEMYKVDQSLTSVERDPKCDDNLKAILGATECHSEKKENVVITKKMVKESVECLYKINDTLTSLLEEAEELYKNCTGKILKYNRALNENSKSFKELAKDGATCISEQLVIYKYIKGKLNNTVIDARNSASIIGAASYYDPENINESIDTALIISHILEEDIIDAIEQTDGVDFDAICIQESLKENIQKLRVKLVSSDEKFLEKYKQQALKSKCSGVVIEKWIVPNPELEKNFSEAKKEVEKFYKTEFKNEKDAKKAYDEVKKGALGSLIYAFTSYDKTKGGDINRKFAKGTFVTSSSLGIKKEENHKVTPSDVSNAVKYLIESPKLLTDAKEQKKSYSIKYATSENHNTIGKSKKESFKIKIEDLKNKVMSELYLNYYYAKTKQITALRQQCRLVIMKAARASEKSIKEECVDYIKLDLNVVDYDI